MGYKLCYQQKSLYKHCPRCGTLLVLLDENCKFAIGHNMNYCYHCGKDLNKDRDILKLDSCWDIHLVCDGDEYMLYNSYENILYTNIPEEIRERFDVSEIDFRKSNPLVMELNCDYE